MTYLNFHLVAATLLLLLCFPGRKCSGFAPARSSQHCPTPTSSSRSTIKILALPKDGTLEVFRTYTDINSEKEEVNQVTEAFNIAYKIYRPMSMSSRQAAPLVVLHGGPSVPSDYLYPLAGVVPYRTIIYFDQLGCGKSDEPDAIACYSIEQGIHDLEQLIQKLGLRQFHLFGQSFGGILGYEFLKRRAEQGTSADDYKVLSLTLSSTPTSVPQVEAQVQDLLQALLQENEDETTVEERFQKTHICRTEEPPKALEDAYAHAGTVWRGTNAIADYVAKPPSENADPLPPAMVMRGEHDFVTEECCRDWKGKIWNQKRIREKVVDGCSHHGLLENGFVYGDMVDSFCIEYDIY